MSATTTQRRTRRTSSSTVTQDRRARAKAKALEHHRERGRQGRQFETSFGDELTVDEQRQAHTAGRAERNQQHRKAKAKDRRRAPARAAQRTARAYANPRSRQRAQLRARRRKVSGAARQLAPTAAGSIATGSQALLLSIVVVGLYVLLQNAAVLTGFLGGAARGLEWLARPDKVIRHKS